MAEILNNKVDLSSNDLDMINKFIGFGDFNATNLLFFGIEEGLGPQKIDDIVKKHLGEVQLRLDKFVSKPNLCVSGLNKDDGFWTSGIDTDSLRQECYRELGFPYSNPKAPRGLYLNYLTAILFILEEDSDEEAQKWRNPSQVMKDKIKKRLADGFFNVSTGMRPTLADWRPLPRQKEDTWCYSLNEIEYLTAFDFKPSTTLFERLRSQRLEIYKKLLNTHHIPVIIGLKKEPMYKLFKNIFSNISTQELNFFQSGLPQNKKIIWAKVEFPLGQTLIICMDHPSAPKTSYETVCNGALKIRQLLRGHDNEAQPYNK